MSKDRPWGKGTPTWVRDATLNDSDKSWTIPAGKQRMYRYIFVELKADAGTAGNRILSIDITDGTNIVYSAYLGNVVAANESAGWLLSTEFSNYITTYPDGDLTHTFNYSKKATLFLPEMVLLPGYVVRIYDAVAISAATDDLLVIMNYVEYDI